MPLPNTVHTGPRKTSGQAVRDFAHTFGVSLNGGFGVRWLFLLNPALAGIVSFLGA